MNNDELRARFKKGDSVVVPRGSRIWQRGEWRTSKRKQTVTVWTVFDGYLDPYTGRRVPPKISWAGSGGYWTDAVIDEALIAANDHEML